MAVVIVVVGAVCVVVAVLDMLVIGVVVVVLVLVAVVSAVDVVAVVVVVVFVVAVIVAVDVVVAVADGVGSVAPAGVRCVATVLPPDGAVEHQQRHHAPGPRRCDSMRACANPKQSE